jgi:hypothetical protein
MFVKTNLQRSLLECEFLLPAKKVARLKKSWAEPFRKRVLPLISEEVFRDAFSDTMGRPNKSVRLLVSLHLLKEWNDLTDEQVLDELEYNLQWHYALGIESGQAHVCQKTLHNFRVKLMNHDRAQQVFEEVTRALAAADGLGLGRQRLDSTHVVSNIAILTRLGLFVETVTHFLKALRKQTPEALACLDAGYMRRYLDREGYFSDAKREQARRRLPVVAQDVYDLVRSFEDDEVVSKLPAFGSLKRLFEEQCEIVEDENQGDEEDGGAGGSSSDGGVRTRVKPREPKTIPSDSLQSPHDPDATYGHKGKGYEVQVSESCDDDNPYQVITGTSINGAHESDQKAVSPMLDQLEASDMLPEELLADTGYGSGANIVNCALCNVDLQAPVRDSEAPEPTEHFAAPVSEEVTAPAGSEREAQRPDHTSAQPGSGPDDGSPPETTTVELEHRAGLEEFTFDATYHDVLRCPGGKPPADQHVAGGQLFAVFSSVDCSSCPQASRCPTRLLANGDRQLRRAPATIATEVRQHDQQQPAFKERYRKRSGVESTNHELKGRHGLDDLRVRGKPRVELGVRLKSLALNVKRAVQYHVCQIAETTPCPGLT